MRLIKWGVVLALVGLVMLGVSVAVAYTQLPSYQSLSNRGDLGQNIRVRSADGRLLVQLGLPALEVASSAGRNVASTRAGSRPDPRSAPFKRALRMGMEQ